MELKHIEIRLLAIEDILRNNKDVYKPKDAALYLGISLGTLYKLTSAGILPFSKPNGKLIYFSKESLDKWMLSNGKKGSDQNDIEAATYISNQK